MGIFQLINENTAYILLSMAVIILVLLVLIIVFIVQNANLKKKYEKFMSGKDGSSLEDVLMKRVSDIDKVMVGCKENKRSIEKIYKNLNYTFQKVGVVKYDAFHEMGGKLSFSIALLNKLNDGFIINAMHSREGCYTYIKEIIKGNPIILLSEEEKEALEMALESNNDSKEKKKSKKN